MPSPGTWDALLNVTQAKLSGSGVERRKLALDALVPNPDQPREHFDAEALTELAGSIKTHGVLQPILVRPLAAGKFQIVAGERRFQAARQAGLEELPVVVRELSDAESLELALVENVMREDISPLEEARTLKRLIEAFGYSYAQLGERLGKNKAYVDHRVRLLKMPEEIQDALASEVVDERGKAHRPFTPRHAGVVSQLDDAPARRALIAEIVDEGLSVAAASRRKDERLEPTPAKKPARAAGVAVATLAITRLIDQARAGNGQADAAALLAALESDLATLRARPGR